MNNQYKDSLFTRLFSNPASLRELYNAIAGASYGEQTPVSINTLSDVLFMERLNDVSFTIDNKLIVLIEHQSSINRNMPLRFLLYAARVYEKLLAPRALYQEKRLPLPRPEFIALYNGLSPLPQQEILRLSDAFIKVPGMGEKPALDLSVKVLNINLGRDGGILERCGTLEGYARFVAKVRENQKDMGKEEALISAIKYCISGNILRGFLEEHASEVVNMLYTEWNWDDAKAVWQEEAAETAREEDEKRFYQDKLESAQKMKKWGDPVEKIVDVTGLSYEDVEGL
jgi:hypothetical protein